MKSIAFPKMFNTNSTNVVKDFDATAQNLVLTLGTEKGELFGDPYFGLRLKKFLYEQNNAILRDMLIDEIYTQVALFMPQLIVKRSDIKIVAKRAKLYCKIKATNQANFKTNL